MRSARWLVTLLMCVGIPLAPAVAAPVTYEFEGFLTKHDLCEIAFDGSCDDPGSRFYPNSFVPGMKFTGTMTLDTTLTGQHPLTGEMGTAPVIELELHNPAGDAIHQELPSGRDSYLTTSQREASLGYAVTGGGDGVDEVVLRYQAAVDGQIPTDPASLDAAALQPSHWLLTLNRATCFAICRPFDEFDRLTGHITSIRRQGSGGGEPYVEPFTTTPAGWTSQGGSWSAVNGQYRNASNVSFTSSIHTARSLQSRFEVSARLSSGFGASGNTLGLIFNYANPSNFYEIRFNPLGTVTFNAVINGTRTMVQSGRYQTSGAGTFFTATVRREENSIDVFVNGAQVFDRQDARLVGGHAGVFSSWNLARVDDFRLTQSGQVMPWNLIHSTFDFDPSASGWTPLAGSWSVQNGRYGNSTNASFVVSLANQVLGNTYSIDADVAGRWRASGNQSGFVYDYENASNYRELRLVPTPSNGKTLRFVEVRAGVRTVVTEWTPPIGPSHVALVRRGDVTIVRASPGGTFALRQAPRANVRAGLLASWNLVSFDNVVLGAAPQ
jgi:hypothetical protein